MGPPPIAIHLVHRHTADGEIRGDLDRRQIEESFYRVRKEFPFLARARLGEYAGDYQLELRSEIAGHDEWTMRL